MPLPTEGQMGWADPLNAFLAADASAAFQDAVVGEGFRLNGAPSRDADGMVIAAPVIYPDGSTGVYTVTGTDSNGAVTAFTATTTGGPLGTKTATVTIPRDPTGLVNGAVTVAVA